jgi:SAM-dependent methyltransferase
MIERDAPDSPTPGSSPVPGGVTAQNLAYYDSRRGVAEYTREEGLRRLEAELVAAHFPPAPAAVLDLGCGAGRTTVGLAGLGHRVTAIDLSEALLGEARRRHPGLDFRRMDATALDLPDASFDAALFSYNGIDCIYPLTGRRRALAEVFRILRPGGTFLFSSHNWVGTVWSGGYFYPAGYLHAAGFLAAQIGNRHLFEGYFLYRDDGGPQHLYSAPPGATVRQLEAAGFAVAEVAGYRRAMPRGAVSRRSQHVHFAARKPPA